MSRLRAVEHGRTVVVAATSGISAIIAPDGTRQARSERVHRRTCSSVTVVRRQRDYPRRAALGRRPRVGRWPRSGWPGWSLAARRAAAVGERDRTGAGDEGERMSAADRRAGPGGHPDLQRGREPGARRWPAARRGARGARAGRRRRQPGRHRRARRPAGRRRRARARAAPHREGRPGRGLRRRLPLGAGRARLRRASSRWTPTARTRRSSCPGCWPRCDDADLVLGSR